MSTPPFQPYTSRGRATSQRQSTQGPRGIDRENLRTPQRIPSAPPRLRPIREAKNEPPIRPLPSASSMPVIEASPPPRRPRTPPPELDIPHEGLMLIELKTNVKVNRKHTFSFDLLRSLAIEYGIPQYSISIVLLDDVFVCVAGARDRCYVATITTLPRFCDLEAEANKERMSTTRKIIANALGAHRAFGIVQWYVAPHLRHVDDVHSIPCSVKGNASSEEGRSKENQYARAFASSLGTESARQFPEQGKEEEPAKQNNRGQQGQQEDHHGLKPKKSFLKMILGKN